ncbi:hypothetical protein BJF78_01080 [Pseudonocardia sp. CNS-139]|nr:hypothetical protein BJF78_01080 [Pseudonocardia sp. CNS-139]
MPGVREHRLGQVRVLRRNGRAQQRRQPVPVRAQARGQPLRLERDGLGPGLCDTERAFGVADALRRAVQALARHPDPEHVARLRREHAVDRLDRHPLHQDDDQRAVHRRMHDAPRGRSRDWSASKCGSHQAEAGAQAAWNTRRARTRATAP